MYSSPSVSKSESIRSGKMNVIDNPCYARSKFVITIETYRSTGAAPTYVSHLNAIGKSVAGRQLRPFSSHRCVVFTSTTRHEVSTTTRMLHCF
jgi:hypothetical protein